MCKILSRLLIAALLSMSQASAATREELMEMTATIINVNGLLCAKVVDIKPLKVGANIYEVRCIEYRGGTGEKTYIMNAAEGKAWAP